MKMNDYIELVNDKLNEFLQIEYPESIFKSKMIQCITIYSKHNTNAKKYKPYFCTLFEIFSKGMKKCFRNISLLIFCHFQCDIKQRGGRCTNCHNRNTANEP